jgi:hypothetical protein
MAIRFMVAVYDPPVYQVARTPAAGYTPGVMPSRPAVVGILLFWLATAGYVFHRDIYPRLFADAPPPLLIDLADEATQLAPTFWTVSRGSERVGRLGTRMRYDADTDRFRFVSTYTDLKLSFGGRVGVGVRIPSLEITVIVTRAGELRGQNLTGSLSATVAGVPLGSAKADVAGRVADGLLVGGGRITSPLGDFEQAFDPTPVPAGQVLNPLLPVNRLQDVRPGRRWVVREVNPLADAVAAVVQQVGKKTNSEVALGLLSQVGPRPELVGEVLADPEDVPRKDGPDISCWVIVYRGEQVAARTWVSRADGRVLRQEARMGDEVVRFDRED